MWALHSAQQDAAICVGKIFQTAEWELCGWAHHQVLEAEK